MGSTIKLNDSPLNYCYRRSESQVYQLVSNLGKLFTDRNLFDCSIICEGNQVIRGHKLMLSASSDYFKTAFTSFGGGGDDRSGGGGGHSVSHSCSNTAIIIREIPYSDLKLIIDYIYSGEMIIPAGQLSSIQKSCQWLKVNCLPLTVTATGSSNKSVTKINSNLNANFASSNRIKIKSDATPPPPTTVPPTTIKINNGRLSISETNNKTLTNGHQNNLTNINNNNPLNRVPSLLYPLRLTNQQQPLIKMIDSSQSTDHIGGGSKGVKTSNPTSSPSSTSSLSLKIVSSPNENRKVYSTSSSSSSAGGGESFVQLRELLRREPITGPESGGSDGNGNRNDSMISNQQNKEGGVEEEFDQNRVDQMKHDDCNDQGDDHKRIDDDHGEEKMELERQEELIVEEEVEGDGVVIEEDADEEEEEEEEGDDDDKYNECNDGGGQGQEVDNAGYFSSEEFEIDIPRSNELHQQSDQTYYPNLHHHHQQQQQHGQKMDITEESNVLTTNEVEIEEEDEEEEEEEDEDDRGRMEGRMRCESSGEHEDEEEEEEDEEDEVIDMRVNSGRRFDHHHIGKNNHHNRHLPYNQPHHHSFATASAFHHHQGQNLEAAVAAVAAVAASTTGSTVNLMDECPSSDSLDLDCGDKLRATNYSMIPFTTSIASSFNSATARAIAASTTLAVASGLLSKSQQLQNHSSSSSSTPPTTTTTPTPTTSPGINGGAHLTNCSSAHQLHSQHHRSSSHPHSQHSHSHEIIYKTTSSKNPDSHSEVSTVPLKRGRGRPPRHLRETPLNGSSATSLNSTSESFRTYKVRNILPSATTSDLTLHTNNNNHHNNHHNNINNKGNHNNQLDGDSANHHQSQHQHHHLILSTSSNLGLTLKRKIRLNNNGGLIGLVSGSTKGRKPKLSTQSTDCSNNNGKNVCPFCPQVYYSNQAMNDHINNVHTGNSRKYTCDLCSKEFSWKISLTKHLRNSHKPDKLTEQLTSNNNLIDSRQQQQLTLTNM